MDEGNGGERVVRWGVLGCADIAVRRVIPALQATAGNAVVAIGSRNLARAKAVAADLGIARAYGSYAEVLDDADVDAVYIPLPNTLHAEWTIRAAAAGKHVLGEKPMATSVADCRRMVAACRAAGVSYMEACMYRFHPQHARVRALIADGVIGEPKVVRASFCVRMQRPPADIRYAPDLGGGSLFDVGVYALDAVRWLLGGDPVAVSGQVALDARGIDASATAALAFPDGVLASVTCSFDANAGGSYEVVGPLGTISVPQAFAQPPGKPPRIVWPGGEEAFAPDINQYALMVDALAASVRESRPPPFPADQGIGNIAIIEALQEAAAPGAS